MPHIVVKMIAGRSEELKHQLAERITEDVVKVLNVGEESVSVAIEDIRAGEWTEKVYNPDISTHLDQLYKKPGYDPLT